MAEAGLGLEFTKPNHLALQFPAPEVRDAASGQLVSIVWHVPPELRELYASRVEVALIPYTEALERFINEGPRVAISAAGMADARAVLDDVDRRLIALGSSLAERVRVAFGLTRADLDLPSAFARGAAPTPRETGDST